MKIILVIEMRFVLYCTESEFNSCNYMDFSSHYGYNIFPFISIIESLIYQIFTYHKDLNVSNLDSFFGSSPPCLQTSPLRLMLLSMGYHTHHSAHCRWAPGDDLNCIITCK